MELLYWGGDSAFAYVQQQTATYLAQFPQTTLLVRRIDHLDQLEAEEPPLCVFTDQQQALSAQVVVLIQEEPSQQISGGSHDWQLFRNSNDEIHFAQLMRYVALQAERALVHHAISTPMAHDLRGTLGVVALSAELLRNKDGMDKIAQKLLSARTKAETLISELQIVSSPYFFSQLPTNKAVEAHHSVRSLNEVLNETVSWFSAAHREHQFSFDPLRPGAVAARYSGLILRGVVDTLARLSPRPAAVRVSQLDDCKLQIAWEAPLALEHQMLLQRLSPEHINGLPSRWQLCLYAARADESRLTFNFSDSQSILVYEY